MGAPRGRADPDVVTGGTRAGGSAAAVLDFAVGQIMRDDTALGALRQVAPALPVVVVTAQVGAVTALLSHADEYLEKPLRVDGSSPRPPR